MQIGMCLSKLYKWIGSKLTFRFDALEHFASPSYPMAYPGRSSSVQVLRSPPPARPELAMHPWRFLQSSRRVLAMAFVTGYAMLR